MTHSTKKSKRQHKPIAKKIKVLKVEPLPALEGDVEPRHHVELEVIGAPVPLPESPLTYPVEVEADEFLGVAEEAPPEKQGLIAWLKSWWR